MTCCSLIWLRAEDKVECQIQISGQTWILYFGYQTSSWFGKVMLSPAHAMWRTPVICWKVGWSCCEKLPVWKPTYERLFWLTLAAAGDVHWERRTTETCLDSNCKEKHWCKEKPSGADSSFVPFFVVMALGTSATFLFVRLGLRCTAAAWPESKLGDLHNYITFYESLLLKESIILPLASVLRYHFLKNMLEDPKSNQHPSLRWQKVCAQQTAWSAKY